VFTGADDDGRGSPGRELLPIICSVFRGGACSSEAIDPSPSKKHLVLLADRLHTCLSEKGFVRAATFLVREGVSSELHFALPVPKGLVRSATLSDKGFVSAAGLVPEQKCCQLLFACCVHRACGIIHL
jgi:hypothetical protein